MGFDRFAPTQVALTLETGRALDEVQQPRAQMMRDQPARQVGRTAIFQQMRQRQVPSDEIERDIDARFRQPIRRQLS